MNMQGQHWEKQLKNKGIGMNAITTNGFVDIFWLVAFPLLGLLYMATFLMPLILF